MFRTIGQKSDKRYSSYCPKSTHAKSFRTTAPFSPVKERGLVLNQKERGVGPVLILETFRTKTFRTEKIMGRNDELKIQAQCFRYLRSIGIFCHSIPNEADGRSVIAQQQLMAAGLTPGVADMLVWWPGKNSDEVELGYLELKTAKGKQSEYQKTFERKCHEAGIRYDLVRSLDELKDLVIKAIKSD